MNKKIITQAIAFLFVAISITYGQSHIHGFISDASTKERLIGATIRVDGKKRGATSNAYGYFSLPRLESSELTISVTYLGYTTAVVRTQPIGSDPIEILLHPTDLQSQEVIVAMDRYKANLSSTAMGINSLPVHQVKSLPSVGGEVDLIKAVQLQAGVASGQEWSNGIYVRGGSFDQNLILLDGVTIYNPNHLFGFFSIFNTDAVKDVELIKGGIPVEYGGRLSSVLSFTLNEGNRERTTWKGGVSLIASRLSVEGPFMNKEGAFLVSARRSYLDVFLWAIGGFKDGTPDFYIYDLTAKANYNLSPTDRVYVSGYFGKDNLKNSASNNGSDIFSIDMSWGNQAYMARWNHLWASNLFTNVSAAYSDYSSEQKEEIFNTFSAREPSVKDVSIKIDGEYYLNDAHTVRFGGAYLSHRYRATAGLLQEIDETIDLSSTEIQSYLSQDWKISERLRVNTGVRADYFSNANAVEIDPRLNLRYSMTDDLSIKFSYTRMHQFVHLLSTAVFSLPGDIFYPATAYLKPQTSQQVSAGLVSSLSAVNAPDVELSVEAYYKDMKKLPMFRQKYSSPSPERIQQDVVIGKGWAYGVDVQLSKQIGPVTGWLSYSYLFVRRQYDEVNGGRAFRPKFERTHQLNAVVNYPISGRWGASAIFVVASGQPITVPRQKYFIFEQDQSGSSNEDYVLDYGDIYSVKLPMYNRLDVSFTRKWEGYGANWELFLNLYNVYAYPIPLYTSYVGDTFTQFNIGIVPTLGVNFSFY